MAPVYVNNIVINAGADFSQIFSLKDSNSNSAIDLTNYIVASQMRKWTGSAASVTFATVIVDPPTLGQVEISLTSEETSNIKPGRYIYDIVIEDVNGNVTRVYEGMVHVRERATYYGSSNGGSGGNTGIGSVFVIQIGYGCSNPIISIGATIGITSASNAYGARYISTEAPVDPCDGDIWYQPGISTVVGGSGAIIACCTSNFISCNTSLPSITSAANNFFVGCNAGNCTTFGSNNNFFGACAGLNNTSGSRNNFFGIDSGLNNSDGSDNNFFGKGSGCCSIAGYHNNFLGKYSGRYNTLGSFNNFFGYNSGNLNTTGTDNNFFGSQAGFANTDGSYNNFFGYNAGSSSNGSYNNFFGYSAGSSSNGSCNIAIGHNVQLYNSSGDNQLAIGVGNSTWIIGNENFNVGIGTNNPSERLEVHGNISINNFVIYGNSNTAVSHGDLSPVTIDSTLSIDEYDSVEYTIRARNQQNVIQTAKVIAVGYGITVSHNQYGTTYVSTNTPLTSYSVDSIDNKFVLISTPTNSEFINYIISFVAFKKYTYIAYD
jgi:hypothetical protein